MEEFYLLLALFGFYVYSLFKKRLGSTIFSLPLLMMLFGLALAAPVDLVLEEEVSTSFIKFVAEVTLILVLFSDSSSIKLASVKRIWNIPARMLIIGMPLSIALGTIITGALLPDVSWLFALLIAAMLAPTDAALAQPVVQNENLPPILTGSLNVESGLNDGLAVPFVFGAATILAGNVIETPLMTVVTMLTLGPIAGAFVGYMTARALDWAKARDFTSEASSAVVYMLTPFMAYLFAELLGGNGFIAAFVGGMIFGNTVKQPVELISDFMESEGQILTMLSFFVFGAFVLPDAFELMSGAHFLLAILFLTLIRMLPVYLSLAGTGISAPNKLFLGWFGPRGLASILYVLLVADEYDIPNADLFFSVVSLTVLLSVILHGVSAMPLAQRVLERSKRVQSDADLHMKM